MWRELWVAPAPIPREQRVEFVALGATGEDPAYFIALVIEARKNVIHPICACAPLSRKDWIFLNFHAGSVTQPGVGWAGAICENTRPTAPGETVMILGLPLMKGPSK